jgi:tetratricopeptide (TPR) repeat protein
LEVRLNNLPEAEAKARQAVALRSELRDQYPAGWAGALATLAFVLQKQGRLPEAEDYQRQAIVAYEKQAPALAWVLPSACVQLSQILLAQNRLAEAEQAAVKAYDLAHKSAAKLSGKKYTTDNLRTIYKAEGKEPEAARLE